MEVNTNDKIVVKLVLITVVGTAYDFGVKNAKKSKKEIEKSKQFFMDHIDYILANAYKMVSEDQNG